MSQVTPDNDQPPRRLLDDLAKLATIALAVVGIFGTIIGGVGYTINTSIEAKVLPAITENRVEISNVNQRLNGLETRMSNLESGQQKILELLAQR
ncbi:MAG: hypothetical protein WA902_01645 [Thermosynechococcaceae cyanobacterium]